jgi:soluble lytic murein transglycosylase-like protein
VAHDLGTSSTNRPGTPQAPNGDAQRLATALTGTTRELRDALSRWDTSRPVPTDVTLLALAHQRMLRSMSSNRRLGDAVLVRLPADVRGGARDTVLARRELLAIPRGHGKRPRVRIGPAAPAAQLDRFYAEAQRRFGIDWSVLAAVNFVESIFGRLRNHSSAGARGPMQFLPATWRRYGMGGNVNDPHDAILGAANYLRRSGAPRSYVRALYAYNNSMHYVRAVRRFAAAMRRDRRMFLAYYAWPI